MHDNSNTIVKFSTKMACVPRMVLDMKHGDWCMTSDTGVFNFMDEDKLIRYHHPFVTKNTKEVEKVEDGKVDIDWSLAWCPIGYMSE